MHSPPPKVVIALNAGWNIVNFRAGLVRALVAAGHEVVAIAADDGHGDAIRALGARFVPIAIAGHGTSPVADLRLLAAYHRILRRERPGVFLGFTIKPNIYGSIAARLLGIPVIANIAGLGITFQRGGWLNRLVRAMYARALRGAATVFFQNPSDREVFVSGRLVAAAASALLPGSGVDLSRFTPTPLPGDADAPAFVMIVRLLWSKGVREYAAAGRALHAARPGAQVRLLGILDHGGDAVDRASLDAWHAAGDIDFLGAAADVRPELARADCVVLPSYYPEGTPRSLLEAAASGRPIITTDMPGCRDVVVDGVNGFLCRPRDADDLAAAMARFAALDPAARQAMGDASRRLAETRFDERLVIAAYRDAIAAATG